MTTEIRRHRMRLLVWALGYAGLLVLSRYLLAGQDVAPAMRIAIALVPILPVFGMIGALLALLRALDELQRQVALEALAGAALLVGAASFAWGLAADVADLPRLTGVWVLPALFALFALVQGWLWRRYR